MEKVDRLLGYLGETTRGCRLLPTPRVKLMHLAEHVTGTPTPEGGPHAILHAEISSRWSDLLSQICPCLPPLAQASIGEHTRFEVYHGPLLAPVLPRLGDFLEVGGGERHCTRWAGLSPMNHPRDTFLRYEHVHYIFAAHHELEIVKGVKPSSFTKANCPGLFIYRSIGSHFYRACSQC
jgi:hypothetical protein